MPTSIETPRLLLRPFTLEDTAAVFEFNSNPQVTQYVGMAPLETMEQARTILTDVILKNYEDYGYGRYAVVHKADNKVIGFSGLKYLVEHKGATDIGYRFLPEYWGKGIATESALPFMDYGFGELGLDRIVGFAYPENVASVRILEKLGLTYIKTAPYEEGDKDCLWYERWKDSRNL